MRLRFDPESPLYPLRAFGEKPEGRFRIHGLKGSSPAYVLSQWASQFPLSLLVVTAHEGKAERLARELGFFLGEKSSVTLYPSGEAEPYERISPSAESMGKRWNVRHRLLAEGKPQIVVASLKALLKRVPPRRIHAREALFLSPGEEIRREEWIERLPQIGYSRVGLVHEVGEFAVRGHLVDLFSPGASVPLRIEFFGDRVESIRAFDPETQRSLETVPQGLIVPVKDVLLRPEFIREAEKRLKNSLLLDPQTADAAGELLEKIEQGVPIPAVDLFSPFFYDRLESLFDFLPAKTVLVLDEPPDLEEAFSRFEEGLEEAWQAAAGRGEFWPTPKELFIPKKEWESLLELFPSLIFQGLEVAEAGPSLSLVTESQERLRGELLASKSEEGILRLLAERIRGAKDKGIRTLLVVSSLRSAQRLEEMLSRHDLKIKILDPPFPEWVPEPSGLWDVDVTLVQGGLSRGFMFPLAGLLIIGEAELFGEKHPRRRAVPFRKDQALANFSDLMVGDFVVHTDHGIGIYRGLLKLRLGKEEHDFLLIEYQGGDKLYVPVYRLNRVQKYVGAGEGEPRIDKLGGTTWENAKKRVKRSLRELAEELVKLYAQRMVARGHRFLPPDELYREFEAAFEYDETPDQQQAIEDVQADMSDEKPMDRLVVGDVGFGKTEVALRAAFRAVMEGKQVAILVPTTVLAQQHQETFSRRFAPYPVRVEMLSRFRSPGEQKRVLEDLAKGKVDLVIGTHRLLQKDVIFKALGLLIVDEEHRFGVTHKEKIKRMRSNVDVLTLTATPIPRTLQMSLGGIRDLSVIESPPEDRQSIRTYIIEFDEEVIREAIRRELRRGGQVFFVHNRVQSIPAMERLLRRLAPEARLAIGHGQMAGHDLEKVMLAFVKKEVDLLLTTTIIESGLDFPSANTIIINRADKLGLAQMYQLRGRVGRSKEKAYAYLLVPGLASIGTDARKRLEALQEVTELGSGMKLAMHDLEIRGAGALLGDAQSGHVAAVGFDMYMQILERAVQELKGEEVVDEVEPEIDLPIPALIPQDYMEDIHQRLIFYRRLSSARSEVEISEIMEEIRDRFGPIPDLLRNLREVMELKLLLKKAGIRRVSAEKDRVVLCFDSRSAIDPARVVQAVERGRGRREFSPDQRLRIRPKERGWAAMTAEVKKILLEIL